MTEEPQPAVSSTGSRWRLAALAFSGVSCGAVWWLLAVQSDRLAWLLILPRWTWLLVGLLFWGLGTRGRTRSTSLTVGLLWLAFTVANIEEATSLARSLVRGFRPAAPAARPLRVVAFNCGGGEEGSIEEAFAQNPDLILFQESPTSGLIQRSAAEHWQDQAALAWESDASIAARGTLTRRGRSPTGIWTWATWLPPGDNSEAIEVVSLRLHPVPLRFDIWTGDCWRQLTRNRETHRAELQELLRELEGLPAGRRCIVGGDFNTPARDLSLAAHRERFRDPFTEAGVGWGNTIVNGMPVQRIDQVWITPDLRAIEVRALGSRHSDHALVICDLALDGPPDER